MRAARRAVRRALPHLLALPHVVGAGAGWRERAGTVTDEPALVVFVVRKLPPDQLAPAARVPERVFGLRTDVVPIGYPRALGPGRAARAPAAAGPADLRLRTRRVRPAPPGVSVGHYRDTAGTLGALVRDRRSGAPLILSNNHVLANRAGEGDGRAAPGDPVLQPGPSDGGTAADVLALLTRYVPLRLVRQAVPAAAAAASARAAGLPVARLLVPAALALAGLNRVDAAVAAPVDPSAVVPEILGLGRPRPPRAVLPGAQVRKSGRTTGVTWGRVRAVATTVYVDMGSGWAALFAEQVIATPMAAPGDSGSLLVDADGHAVGMVAAGSEDSTIANPIGAVLEELGVELVT